MRWVRVVREKGEAAEETEVGQQQEVDHGHPDLSQNGIAGSAEEGFDFEILLDPTEEGLDLPALVIDLGDGGGGEAEVIGEEAVDAAGDGILEGDQAQGMGVFPMGDLSFELDQLVGEDRRRGWQGVLSDNPVTLIGQGPGHEESAALLELVPPVEGAIGPIEAVNAVGLGRKVIPSDGHVMDIAF